MPKTREKKHEEIEALVAEAQKAKGVVFANFAGLTVGEVSALRRECQVKGVTYLVAKKTLLKRAFEAVGITADPKQIQGNVAVIFGSEDELAPAKVISGFAKTHDKLQFSGGLMSTPSGWHLLSVADVKGLAMLPSKEELIAKLVGSLAAPLRGTLGVLSGPSRSLVQVLSAIAQTKS
ncbi:MAG: 50S ribosomal protein L10 [Patescibacteria group bacterium]